MSLPYFCVTGVVVVVSIISIVIFLATPAAAANGPCACDLVSNREILLDFYYSTGGNGSWLPATQYTLNTTVCTWYGVQCIGDAVTGLSLDTNGLRGTLPPSLGRLNRLQQLVINTQPSLSGTIPDEWQNLTSLTYVQLNNCNLSGTIPVWWSGSLLELRLNQNNFSGTLPDDLLTSLSSLTTLDLSRNALSGEIPVAWWDPNHFPTLLSSLRLDFNLLRGPCFVPGMELLSALSELRLNSNKFTGTLPASLTQLSHSLTTLNLSSNRLWGPLPPSWSQLTSLVRFDIRYQTGFRPLCGGIPVQWSYSGALLNGTPSGPMPRCPTVTLTVSHSMSCSCDHDDTRSALWRLYMETGGPSSWIPSARFDQSLSICQWYGVRCNGALVWSFTVINDIGMSGTVLPEALSLLPSLRILDIRNQAKLSGSIPDSWRALSNLTTFRMQRCGIHGTLPADVFPTTLEVFSLSGNALEGTFPFSYTWYRMDNMTAFNIKDNLFNGTLPWFVPTYQKLTAVDVSNNSFTGEVWDYLQQTISWVNLSTNSLSGTLPWWLRYSPSLATVDVSNNRLYGTLQDTFSSVFSLNTLNLNRNFFHGPLPSSWSFLLSLKYFSVEHQTGVQRICGGIPAPWLAKPTLLAGVIAAEVNTTCTSISRSVSPSITRCACDTRENRHILETFFYETGGPTLWYYYYRWDITQPLCTWYGVGCDFVTGVVTFLHFDGTLRLNGTLPAILGNLSGLTDLSIQYEYYMTPGPMPDNFASLRNLVTLQLNNMQFTREIPLWVWTLPKLSTLSLTGNIFNETAFSDMVPSTVESPLTTLYLYSNSLYGEIPKGLRTIRTLNYVSLGGNYLNGTLPSWLGHAWPELVSFNVGGNLLDGPLPGSNGIAPLWPSILSIFVGSNNFYGTLPQALMNLTSLRQLSVGFNRLYGTLPRILGPNVSFIQLQFNALGGRLPPRWAESLQVSRSLLRIVNLRGQRGIGFCGGLPDSWNNVTVLRNSGSQLAQINQTCHTNTMTATKTETVCLCDSRRNRFALWSLFNSTGGRSTWDEASWFDDSMPLCLWPHVTCDGYDVVGIFFYGNIGMTGTLPPELAYIGSGLLGLAITGQVNLTGTIPQEYSVFVNLESFEFSSVSITSPIPEWLGNCTNLTYLTFNQNPNFFGSLPASLGKLRRLQSAALGFTNVSGTLPPEWGGMTSLQFLGINGNSLLSGTLPAAWGGMASLTMLGCRLCPGLSGTIPSTFANMTMMRAFTITSAKLSGTVPSWIGTSWTQLTALILTNCQLSGTLPAFLPPLLVRAALDGNVLIGPLPRNWANSSSPLSYLSLTGQRGKGFCGGMPESWKAIPVLNNSVSWDAVTGRCHLTQTFTISKTSCEHEFIVASSGSYAINSTASVCESNSRGCYNLVSGTYVVSIDGSSGSESAMQFGINFDAVNALLTVPVRLSLQGNFDDWLFASSGATSGGGGGMPVLLHQQQYQPTSGGITGNGVLEVVVAPGNAATSSWSVAQAPYRRQVVSLFSLQFRCASERRSIDIEFVVNPRSVSSVVQAMGPTTAVAGWTTALSSSGATASTAAKIAAVQRLLLCSPDVSTSGGGLLGWSISSGGSSANAYGAVLGNSVVVAAFATASMIVVVAHMRFTHGSSLRPSLLRLHFPSLLFPVYSATLPSSVGGVVGIVAGRETQVTGWIVALLGVLLWGGGLVWLIHVGRRVVNDNEKKRSLLVLAPVEQQGAIRRLMRRHSVWVVRRELNEETGAAMTTSLGGDGQRAVEGALDLGELHILLKEYSRLWYPSLDAVCSMISGGVAAVSGLGLGQRVCEIASIVLCVVFVLLLVVTALARPFTTHFGFAYQIVMLLLSALCVLFQVLYGVMGDALSQWPIVASTTMALGVLGVSLARSAVDMLDLVRGVVRLLRDSIASREKAIENELGSESLMLTVINEEDEALAESVASMLADAAAGSNSNRPELSTSFFGAGSFKLSDVENGFWDSRGVARPADLNASRSSDEHNTLDDLLTKK